MEHQDPEDKTGRYLEIFLFPSSNSLGSIGDYPRRVPDVLILLDQSLPVPYDPNNLEEGQSVSVTNLDGRWPEGERGNVVNPD
jgi:DUF917 family protein